MTEPKSKCCGADYHRKYLGHFDGVALYEDYCSQCHKPCEIQEVEEE